MLKFVKLLFCCSKVGMTMLVTDLQQNLSYAYLGIFKTSLCKLYVHFDQSFAILQGVHFVLRFGETKFMFGPDLCNTPSSLSLAQLSPRCSDHEVFYILLGLFFPIYPVALLEYQECAHFIFFFLVTFVSFRNLL